MNPPPNHPGSNPSARKRALRTGGAERTTSQRATLRSEFFRYHAEPLAILDNAGRFVDVNPAFERAVGRKREDISGRGFLNVVPREAHEHVKREFVEARRKSTPVKVEVRFFPVDAPPRWFCWVFTPADEGHVFVSGHDVTERLELGRLKDEFVSVVSHELRTPMTSVSGSLGLVLGGVTGPMPDKANELIQIAYNNCQRLIRLINDILDIEKIESGKVEFRMQHVDLRALVERAIASNEAYADKFGVRIAADLDAAPPTVFGDPDRLTQVLTNLISNAAKFSPQGEEVLVSVRIANAKLRVIVADRGAGIPDAVRPRLFQRFVQADSSDTRNAEGTGLGLSIVKSIVEHHEGAVGFRDRAGGGTEFIVDLPMPTYEHSALIPIAPADSFVPASVLGGVRAQKVLVVESDADLVRVLEAMLSTHGEVRTAATLDDALALAQSDTFDAIVVEPAVDIGDPRGVVRALRDAAPEAAVLVYSEEPYPAHGPAPEVALVKGKASPRMLQKALVMEAQARRAA